MPSFKVRDLMINVLPEGNPVPLGGGFCPIGTICAALTNCGPLSWCGPGNTFCNWKTCHWITPFHCQPCTFAFTVTITTTFPTGCGPVTCGITELTVTDPGTIVINPAIGMQGPEALATLRAQLTQALANLDEQQKVADQALQPKSVGDAELLEKKLEEALAEVRALKEQLRKDQG